MGREGTSFLPRSNEVTELFLCLFTTLQVAGRIISCKLVAGRNRVSNSKILWKASSSSSPTREISLPGGPQVTANGVEIEHRETAERVRICRKKSLPVETENVSGVAPLKRSHGKTRWLRLLGPLRLRGNRQDLGQGLSRNHNADIWVKTPTSACRSRQPMS